jgi:hypothetical protein
MPERQAASGKVVGESLRVRSRGIIRQEGRPEEEGQSRVLGASLTRFGFGAEDFTHDQLHARLKVLAHHAGAVGVGGVFSLGVIHRAGSLQRLGGDVDAADPLLLHRHVVDARHAKRFLRKRREGRVAAATAAAPPISRPRREKVDVSLVLGFPVPPVLSALPFAKEQKIRTIGHKQSFSGPSASAFCR